MTFVNSGRGEQNAIIFDSVSDTKYTLTFAQLQDKVATFAGALAAKGVVKDRVVIYMPMIPEAVIAMPR